MCVCVGGALEGRGADTQPGLAGRPRSGATRPTRPHTRLACPGRHGCAVQGAWAAGSWITVGRGGAGEGERGAASLRRQMLCWAAPPHVLVTAWDPLASRRVHLPPPPLHPPSTRSTLGPSRSSTHPSHLSPSFLLPSVSPSLRFTPSLHASLPPPPPPPPPPLPRWVPLLQLL
ncbi:hypothetical protein E2C01_072461 [Portunus trituberculatus]|uniref:Uncharacterized protein n=1 Tax=Portunus trituberculatus TaxID=210409 RepID=A0A5B7HY13_PORTR|nr:hypothetical protein [Portunus trituberculatus]